MAIIGAMDETRAETILNGVLRELEDRLPEVDVARGWVADAETVCIIYREIHSEEVPRLLGLRRRVEPDIPLERIIEEIAHREIGEPLGSLSAELVADEDGVWWFEGNRPDWRIY